MEGLFLPVPVRPNASVAVGTIESVSSHPTRAGDAAICLNVRRTTQIADMPDFIHSEIGHSIHVVVRQGQQLNLREGSTVQLTISYEGDESGGGYYANASDYELID
jgi:hypothetical protein